MVQKPPEYFKFCPQHSLLIKQKRAQRIFLLLMLCEIICRSIIPCTYASIPVNLESLQRTFVLQYNINGLHVKNLLILDLIKVFFFFFSKRGCVFWNRGEEHAEKKSSQSGRSGVAFRSWKTNSNIFLPTNCV